MKYLILILIILSTLLSSCKDTKKEDITHLVKEWQGKEIILPKNIVFSKFVTDTTDYQIAKSAPYKVLIYVDSIGCTSCKLQLPKWKEFIKRIDSISAREIPFLFFLHPKDYKEIRYILKRDGFDWPVCIDKEDRLNKLNTFPTNIMFQTFLLDKDNKVCVIGNPIHNLAVQDLYLKQIQGYAEEHPVENTLLDVSNLEYDLGIVPNSTTKEQTVTIKNTGNNTFHIRGITTSCDCTEALYEWKEIQPNESKLITVRYKAEQPGDFVRTITIYGNFPEKSLTLTFIGKVK